MLHVITGGSGSGKSAYAENWLLEQREKNLHDENSENTNPSATLYCDDDSIWKRRENKSYKTQETARGKRIPDI